MPTSVTRFDLYRIIIPGALSLGFAVVALRILAMGAEAPQEGLSAFIAFLEDPLRAFVLAFAVGLLAYFIDPGYAMPEFWERMPSIEVRKILIEHDPRFQGYADNRFVGFYMLIFSDLLPDELRDRALLFGALFRVGVHAILGSLLTAVALPVVLLAIDSSDGKVTISLTLEYLPVPLIALLVTLIMVMRRAMIEEQGSKKRPVMLTLVLIASGVGPWVFLAFVDRPHVLWWIAALGAAFTVGLWLAARFGGRIGPYAKYLVSAQPYGRPREGYARHWVFALDGTLALGTYAGVYALGPSITMGQQVGIVGLVIFGLLFSFFRKHERQQHGIYRNQVGWVRRNIDDVLEAAYRYFGLERPESEMADESAAEETCEGGWVCRLLRSLCCPGT